jgi:DNA invertase Pin-like site-specific DNA recombinase
MPNHVFGYACAPDAPGQLAMIEGYCSQLGLRLGDVFTDPADAAGLSWLQRPAGEQLAARLEPGSAVVVAGLKHLYPSTEELLKVLTEMRARGVTLHIVQVEGSPRGPEASLPVGGEVSDLIVRTLSVLRAFDRSVRSRAVREGMRRRKLEGRKYCRHPGYGFTWKGKKGQERREPHAHEQAVMAKVIEWRQAGYSWYEVAAHLLRHRVLTADGREWSPSRVRRAYRAAVLG